MSQHNSLGNGKIVANSTRKNNSSQAKTVSVSEFRYNENEEESLGHFGKSIERNVQQIRQCKEVTEELMQSFKQTIAEKDGYIAGVLELLKRQKQQSRTYKIKYHETVIQLRRKDEQRERLLRLVADLKNKNQFLEKDGNAFVDDCINASLLYRRRIIELDGITQCSVIYANQRQVEERDKTDNKGNETTIL